MEKPHSPEPPTSRPPRAERDELVRAHLPLVEVLARRFVSESESIDDLRQVGVIGLLKAANRFEQWRGVPFPAYAAPFVLGELRHHVRDCTWPVRMPRAENGDGSRRRQTVAVPLDEAALAAPDALAETEDRLLVASLVRRLGTREREVVYRYFVRERSQADIGRELGLSQIQVSRMLRASLAVMRRRLETLPR